MLLLGTAMNQDAQLGLQSMNEISDLSSPNDYLYSVRNIGNHHMLPGRVHVLDWIRDFDFKFSYVFYYSVMLLQFFISTNGLIL